MISSRVCILGTGAWATALGVLLSKNNNTIFMWGINQKEINDINSGYNKQYFGEKKFSSSLSATNDLKVAIGNSKYILVAVPSSVIISVIEKLKTQISRKSRLVLINVVKGLDEQTQDVISKSIKRVLKGYKIKLVTICGPSFAEEVFYEKPTIVNAASSNFELTKTVCNLFNTELFKVVPCEDEIGLQVYSALKNLLAIGVGLASQHFKSINTMSALLTIGLAEMEIIGRKMGAKKNTIFDFCGIGDMFLTCSSDKSRNFSFGKSIAEYGVDKTIQENKKTVEGFQVSKIVEKIISEKRLSTPLFMTIIQVLKKEIEPERMIHIAWDLVAKNKMNKEKKFIK